MHILLLGLCRVQAVNTRPGYLGAHSLALGHRGRGCRRHAENPTAVWPMTEPVPTLIAGESVGP